LEEEDEFEFTEYFPPWMILSPPAILLQIAFTLSILDQHFSDWAEPPSWALVDLVARPGVLLPSRLKQQH
jgi:hypothetical protein